MVVYGSSKKMECRVRVRVKGEIDSAKKGEYTSCIRSTHQGRRRLTLRHVNELVPQSTEFVPQFRCNIHDLKLSGLDQGIIPNPSVLESVAVPQPGRFQVAGKVYEVTEPYAVAFPS